MQEDSNAKKEPPLLANWEDIRDFMRQEVGREVEHAMIPVRSEIKSHDRRLAVVEATVTSIQKGVQENGWQTAEIQGMLTGFIGTKDVRGKFDIAIDGIRAVADRANVISHAVRDELNTLNLKESLRSGEAIGEASVRKEYAEKKEKRFGIVKWIVGVIGGTGIFGWLKHIVQGWKR